jgi:uncharacterized protein (DUF885 family)
MTFRVDRRTLLAGSALLIAAAAPDHDADARAALDRAAAMPPEARLALLRGIDPQPLSRAVRLDLAAARRGAELETAIAAASDPAARYALRLRLESGFDVTPDYAFSWCMDRARSLTVAADRLLRRLGLAQGSLAERLRRLARDPHYLYSNDDAGRTQAVADMNRWLAAARARLPRQFGAIPAAVDHVQAQRMSPAEEAAGKSGYRTLPSFDGTQPGAYLVDLHDISRRPSWSLPSVVHHELLPGHMMQLPIQARAAPHALRLRAAPGFVEGWAIYAEQLSAETGAFADAPEAELGCLQWLLFRLGRAIIDIGINAHGWTDEAALSFLADLQGDPMIFAPFDKDMMRAQAEPGAFAGQALNWLGIERLREAARGDMRRFHDRLLADGALPLILFPGGA